MITEFCAFSSAPQYTRAAQEYAEEDTLDRLS